MRSAGRRTPNGHPIDYAVNAYVRIDIRSQYRAEAVGQGYRLLSTRAVKRCAVRDVVAQTETRSMTP